MKRLLRSSVLLAACVGFLSCTNDPTGDLGGTPTKLAATPGSLFIEQDATELVDIEVLDEQGGAVPASFSVAVLTPGIDVTVDDEFRPEYNADGVLFVPDEVTKLRLNVTGTSLVESTIRVTSGDLSLDIPVKVIPHDLDVVFSPANPAPGDTVTMTLPPELALSPTSAVTFPGNLNPIIIDRAVDSSSLRFIAAPTTDIEATVTLVNNRVLPQLAPATLTTGSKLTSTTAGLLGEFLPATVSDITPDPLVPITITLDPVFRFKAATTVNFAVGPAGIVQSQSADSTVLTVSVGPNVNAPARIDSILFNGAPQFMYRRFTQDTLVGPVIASMPAVYAPADIAAGETITVTAAGFTFKPDAAVTFGGVGAGIVSIAGDGSSMVILPIPGTTGTGVFSGVAANSAPLFTLSGLPGGANDITVTDAAPAAAHPGTASSGTAPVFAGPSAVGGRVAIVDQFNLGDQFYKFTVPVTGRYQMQLRWQDGDPNCVSDVDLLTTAGNSGTCAHPEIATSSATTLLTAGTTVTMRANVYAVPAQPEWLAITIIRLQ